MIRPEPPGAPTPVSEAVEKAPELQVRQVGSSGMACPTSPLEMPRPRLSLSYQTLGFPLMGAAIETPEPQQARAAETWNTCAVT